MKEPRCKKRTKKYVGMYKTLTFILLISFTLSFCSVKSGLVEPVISIQKHKDINIDGNFDDWNEIESFPLLCNEFGEVFHKDDISAQVAITWNSKGIYFHFLIKDDTALYNYLNPWSADAVEIFISPFKGSEDILQLSIATGFSNSGPDTLRIDDHRKHENLRKIKPDYKLYGKNIGNITEFELFLNTEAIGLQPELQEEIAMQIYVDDRDMEGKAKNRLMLYSSNFSGETSYTHQPFLLVGDHADLPVNYSRLFVEDDSLIHLAIIGNIKQETDLLVKSANRTILETSLENGSTVSVFSFLKENSGIDPEKDSIYIFLDDRCIGFHNLVLAPRKYVNRVEPRFKRAMRYFRLEDQVSFPKPNSALFIGSSSMRMWSTVKDDFPELDVIHRGFGGSNSADVLTWINDIVLPYEPSTVVYYEGDNDIASGFTADSVIRNMMSFVELTKSVVPDVKIYFISPKPSIRRQKIWNKYLELHEEMKKMADSLDNVFYIDVSGPMHEEGKLREDVFLEDDLHMNGKGYEIWIREVRKALGLEVVN